MHEIWEDLKWIMTSFSACFSSEAIAWLVLLELDIVGWNKWQNLIFGWTILHSHFWPHHLQTATSFNTWSIKPPSIGKHMLLNNTNFFSLYSLSLERLGRVFHQHTFASLSQLKQLRFIKYWLLFSCCCFGNSYQARRPARQSRYILATSVLL